MEEDIWIGTWVMNSTFVHNEGKDSSWHFYDFICILYTIGLGNRWRWVWKNCVNNYVWSWSMRYNNAIYRCVTQVTDEIFNTVHFCIAIHCYFNQAATIFRSRDHVNIQYMVELMFT